MSDEALRQLRHYVSHLDGCPQRHGSNRYDPRLRCNCRLDDVLALLSRESGPQDCACRHQEQNHVTPNRPCLLCQCADFEPMVGEHDDVRPPPLPYSAREQGFGRETAPPVPEPYRSSISRAAAKRDVRPQGGTE